MGVESAKNHAQGRRWRVPNDGPVVIPAAKCAKAGVKTQLDGLERIQSRERKTVVKDYIAHLIDAQRAVVLVAKAYQDLRRRVKRAD